MEDPGVVKGRTDKIFNSDLSLAKLAKKQTNTKKTTLKVVACADRGAGNDPEAFGLEFHQGPTFINAYYQAGYKLG